MKRLNHLFEKVIDIDNIRLADARARRSKPHSYGVMVHDKNKDANLERLRAELCNHTFRTSDYTTFEIFEPKRRVIYRLPYYPDRILHHAIMNILEPVWVSVFNSHTYSCIKERGIHKCANDVRAALKENPAGTRYCLKLDVRHFYPSIDHGILKSIVRRKIKDADLLAVLDEIIDSVDANEDGKPGCGIPIGNYLSQYFANLYLAYFDHWIVEEKGEKMYFRYADDIVVFSDSKEHLHALMHDIRAYLKTLRLTVKHNYQVFPVDARGVDFVGYVFYHTHTLLRKSIKVRFCRRVAKIHHRKTTPPKPWVKQQIASWWGWCKYCDSNNLISKIKTQLPYEFSFRKH